MFDDGAHGEHCLVGDSDAKMLLLENLEDVDLVRLHAPLCLLLPRDGR
jgi:hypothetical protein